MFDEAPKPRRVKQFTDTLDDATAAAHGLDPEFSGTIEGNGMMRLQFVRTDPEANIDLSATVKLGNLPLVSTLPGDARATSPTEAILVAKAPIADLTDLDVNKLHPHFNI